MTVKGESRATLEVAVGRAIQGDRAALETILREIQGDVHGLALRFLWHPEDAEDATQEILIKVITGLSNFAGDSSFRTWVYRVAVNTLLTTRKRRAERSALSLEAFGADLERGLSDDEPDLPTSVERDLIFQEVRIGCTMAMLQCLSRALRLAFILGDILELDHTEAATALEIAPAAFRARLSRARRQIQSLMAGHCGLVNPQNACRCRRRLKAAVSLGRIDPLRPVFSVPLATAKAFPETLAAIRELEEGRRAAALYRAQPQVEASGLLQWIRKWIADREDGPLRLLP